MGNDIKGKVAFVTGAASKRGMGHAVAIRLAQEGADVAVFDRFAAPKSAFGGDENWGGLDEVVREIEAYGQKALALTGDIASTGDVEAAVDAALKQLGNIDILVHCAGIRGPVGVPVVEGDETQWRNILDINLLGVFIISKAVAKPMIKAKKGGKIVHVASVAGRMGAPGSAAYAASKWGTIGLVQSLALELAPHKINVNAINPGFFATNLRDAEATAQAGKKGVTVDQFKAEEYAQLAKLVPLGRMGTMDDISDLITFLVSNQSEYMTGQDINITGGFKMP